MHIRPLGNKRVGLLSIIYKIYVGDASYRWAEEAPPIPSDAFSFFKNCSDSSGLQLTGIDSQVLKAQL